MTHLTEADLRDQAHWSQEMFGPHPRPVGLVKHLRKELGEIDAKPDDLTEYADVMILAFDGALRCTDATPVQVLHAFEGAASAIPFVGGDLSTALAIAVEWTGGTPDDVTSWTLIAAIAYEIAISVADAPDVDAANEIVFAAYRNKMAENKQREWQDWRTLGPDEPVEHVR